MPGYNHKGGYDRSVNIVGMRFGKLFVIEKSEPIRSKNGKIECARWKCRCDCGNEIVVVGNSLRRGLTKSCGCIKKENPPNNITHNMSNTNIYKVYKEIKRRCYNKNSKDYKYYGGRGIAVCDEWKNDFMAFYNWSIDNGYKEGLSIDRIDVNVNYCPENCRWITMKEQANNKTNTIYTDDNIPISELARIVGIVSPNIARNRYKAGWSAYDATHIPVLKKGVRYETIKKTN